MTKNLYRRLEHLEEQVIPTGEPRVWQAVYVDSDGTKELGPRIEMPPSRPFHGRWRGADRPQRC